MKQILLLTLFLGSSVSPLFSQKNLPPALQPFAENWTHTLVKSLNRAGFDMPATHTPAAGLRSGAPLQLDSTKTFNNYLPGWPGDSTPLFRTTYRYPQQGLKIETEFAFENGDWLPLSRSSLYYDDQQRLLDVLAEVYDPGSQNFRPDSWLQIFPRGNSDALLDSVFTYAWDTVGLDWFRIFSVTNAFDEEERLQSTTTEVDYLGDPLVFLDLYAYDTNGDNHLIESFAIIDGFAYPDSRSEIMYADHRPIEILNTTHDGVEFQLDNRTNIAYTLFGAVRRTNYFEYDATAPSWNLVQTVDYKYDFANRLSSVETGSPYQAGPHTLVVYTYIDDENLAQEMLLHWDDDLFDWELDNKKFYYYAQLVPVRPTPRAALALQLSPNPTNGQVQFNLEGEAGVQVFSLDGQLVQTRQLQAGPAALDFTQLPAGVYMVSARQGGDLYSGKVVKQ